MFRRIARIIGSLTVGRKLALIYFLDLTAVIFISGILIHEKFIAINFAQKEILGNLYIAEIREAFFAVIMPAGEPALAGTPAFRSLSDSAAAILKAEEDIGIGMRTEQLSQAFSDRLSGVPASPQQSLSQIGWPENEIAVGRELLTRIGNQSNLILDPDLDSYYTMSLVVLRFPELMDILGNTGRLIREMADLSGAERQRAQTRFLILEGRLDAIVAGINSDYSEAFAAASSSALKAALEGSHTRLRLAVEEFRTASRSLAGLSPTPASLENFGKIYAGALLALRGAWSAAQRELDVLVELRISKFYSRMWLHLGTALLLLIAILSLVFFVARQIALPIMNLAAVAENVRRSGDYRLRATWASEDEIGRLVTGFNDMLLQLDSQRMAQQELVAQASAANAQRELVEAIPIPLIVTAIPDHHVLHANHTAKDWISSRDGDPWITGMTPASKARFFQQLSDLGVVDEFEVRWSGGGRPVWALVSARIIVYQGKPSVLATFTPIGQMKQMEARLELWAKVFDASSEGIVVMDKAGKILTVNPSFCRSTAFGKHELEGSIAGGLLASRNDPDLFELVRHTASTKGSWQGEVWVNRKRSDPYPVWLVMNAVRDPRGEITHFIASTLDISERKASEKQIQYLAHHDVLTGLPNRFVCGERLHVSIHQARRTGEKVAVLFVDLDRFKNINDSLGHHVGDGLLCSVAKRLSATVREGDTVCRLGGDEFVIILTNVIDAEKVGAFVERRLIPAMQAPHEVDGVELYISCSIGIALCPDDGDEINGLMRHADTAMYQAKRVGRNNAQFFTTELNERVVKHLHLESDLRNVIERNELILHYQPRIGADGVSVAGVESLVRWQHPTEGLLAPIRFIPLAEEAGMIVPIGAWVIREACRQHAAWRNAGLGEIPVSINLSVMQLRDGSLLQTLSSVLEEFSLSAGQIELELTESILMDNVANITEVLGSIKELGFSLSIDDFGTGYSSLNYLCRFPIDKLKIDQSFIQNIHSVTQNLAVIRAIIGLGHTLGLGVVAEGVECEADVTVLKGMGCDEFQGYYFAHPMLPTDIEDWIARMHEQTSLTTAAA